MSTARGHVKTILIGAAIALIFVAALVIAFLNDLNAIKPWLWIYNPYATTAWVTIPDETADNTPVVTWPMNTTLARPHDFTVWAKFDSLQTGIEYAGVLTFFDKRMQSVGDANITLVKNSATSITIRKEGETPLILEKIDAAWLQKK